MKDFIEAIPWAIIVGPISALLAAYLTNRYNTAQFRQQRDHEQWVRHEAILRKRTEELYVLLQRYMTALSTTNLPYMHVMEGKLDYNQALDLVIQQNKRPVEFHRIEMLIDIYFPQHREAFTKLLDFRSAINEIREAHKMAYLQSASGKPFIKPFTDALMGAENACNALVADIVADARSALSLIVSA
jgi:hypothetical protein